MYKINIEEKTEKKELGIYRQKDCGSIWFIYYINQSSLGKCSGLYMGENLHMNHDLFLQDLEPFHGKVTIECD